MKILVAVDGSEASLHAASSAFSLIAARPGSVTLIYVTPPYVPASDATALLPDPTLEMSDAGLTVLRQAVERLKAPPTTPLLNRVGSPAEVISDVAAEEGFDLVVVGHTGRGAVARVLLGSVADRLVHICSKPVLVVR